MAIQPENLFSRLVILNQSVFWLINLLKRPCIHSTNFVTWCLFYRLIITFS
jgi:hypothetical protein